MPIMKAKEVNNLQRLVEDYWRLFLKNDPHGEPPEFFVNVVDYLEREHRLLFNTYSHRWIDT